MSRYVYLLCAMSFAFCGVSTLEAKNSKVAPTVVETKDCCNCQATKPKKIKKLRKPQRLKYKSR